MPIVLQELQKLLPSIEAMTGPDLHQKCFCGQKVAEESIYCSGKCALQDASNSLSNNDSHYRTSVRRARSRSDGSSSTTSSADSKPLPALPPMSNSRSRSPSVLIMRASHSIRDEDDLDKPVKSYPDTSSNVGRWPGYQNRSAADFVVPPSPITHTGTRTAPLRVIKRPGAPDAYIQPRLDIYQPASTGRTLKRTKTMASLRKAQPRTVTTRRGPEATIIPDMEIVDHTWYAVEALRAVRRSISLQRLRPVNVRDDNDNQFDPCGDSDSEFEHLQETIETARRKAKYARLWAERPVVIPRKERGWGRVELS
jgi:hypothetical protein